MKLTIEQALQQGVAAHKEGKLQDAERLYRLILQSQPAHPDANHNLGVLAVSVNKADAALPLFKTALEANPKIEQFWLSYIDALIKTEKFDTARQVVEQAKTQGVDADRLNSLKAQFSPKIQKQNTARVSPSQELLNSLLGHYQNGRFSDAEKLALSITQDFPKHQFAWKVLGAVLKQTGRVIGSLTAMQKSVKLVPQDAEAHSNLGVTLKELGRLDEALASYNQAIRLKPDFAEAHSNLGVTLQELGRLDEAIASCNQAIALNPDYAEAHYNLGNMLKELGRLDEAEASYTQAIALNPDYAEAHSNLGVTLQELGRLDEAVASCTQAIVLKPDFAEAWNNIVFPLQSINLKTSLSEELASYYPKITGSKYAQIATAILNYRLNLGKESVGRSFNEAVTLISSAENITIKNPENHKALTGFDPMLPNKVVALVHFGRSGTGLLHSLIDAHPEVSTLPSIYLSEYFNHSNWEKIISGSWSQMVDRFMAIYDVIFDAKSKAPVQTKSLKLLYDIGIDEGMANVGNQRNEALRVNKELFHAELQRLMSFYDQLDALLFFKLVHRAYDKAINDTHQKSLIFYHIHNPDTHAQLNFVRSAPEANWIMMVREPVQSCESWLRQSFKRNDYISITNRIRAMLFEIDNVIYHKQNSIGVRLEDLKERPRQTVPALCNWIGITETESLYEMTAQGKKWWGDPSSPDFAKDGMNPFGKGSINRKLGSVFSEKDQFVLRTLFYPFCVRFGYAEGKIEQFKIDLQAIRPMLDQMFDFEKKIVMETKADAEQFAKSGFYSYLRSGMIERWNTLNEYHTYPNMIRPLKIN